MKITFFWIILPVVWEKPEVSEEYIVTIFRV
jgi:hypothetical protein